MPYQTINHLQYHYEQIGSGAPVVLLHGFTGRGRNWEAVSSFKFRVSSFEFMAVDLLGHGLTDSPVEATRYKMEYAAADLATLILDLTTPPVHLVGYSMGGRLALYLALHYPHLFRSLVLESSSPGLASETERQTRRARDEQLAQQLEQEGLETFVDYWETIPLFASQNRLPAEVRQRLRQQRLQNNPVGLANSLCGMGTGIQPSLWEQLPQLHLPVLLLAGELDSKFVTIARQMAAQLPQAQLRLIPNAGHTIHLEQPSGWTETVGVFCARLTE